MTYSVILKPEAGKMFRAISDRRVLEKIASTLERLKTTPEISGKRLGDELSGYWSVRAAGQQYRIIYRIEGNFVFVISIGRRKAGSKKDVYELTRKLIRRGLL